MAQKPEIVFNPKTSRRAQYLLGLSSKELFDRYFVRARNNDKNWIPEFNAELNKTEANGDYTYAYTAALVGKPLEYIPSLVNLKFSAYMPICYKFNGASLVKDMEAMLRENPAQARNSAMSVNTTLFLVQMGDFLVERINHGLDFSFDSLNFKTNL